MRNKIFTIFFLVLIEFTNSINAQTAEAYNHYGCEKVKDGDNKGAIADFDKAIELPLRQALHLHEYLYGLIQQ